MCYSEKALRFTLRQKHTKLQRLVGTTKFFFMILTRYRHTNFDVLDLQHVYEVVTDFERCTTDAATQHTRNAMKLPQRIPARISNG